jgi:hypothetical protein
MSHFYEISQRLKEIISQQHAKEKILDKDIAIALKLNPQYYAVIKRREKIPYQAIALFCQKYRVSMNWILLKQKPKYLT